MEILPTIIDDGSNNVRRNRRTLDAATRTELIRDALVRNLLTDHWECPEWMGVSYAAPEAKSTYRIEKHLFLAARIPRLPGVSYTIEKRRFFRPMYFYT